MGLSGDLKGISPQMPHDVTVDLSMPSTDRNTPLHVAVSVSNISVVTYLLLKKRVDPMAKGANGLLPLEMACALGSCQVVGLLLRDKRTQANHCHPKRGSVLHIAASRDNFQLVQMLLLNHVDLSLKNAEGQLAKDLTSNPKILKLIAQCESMQPDEKLEVADVIVEEEEDDNYLGANFSNSPGDTEKRKEIPPFAGLAGTSMVMAEPPNSSYAFQENQGAAQSMLALGAGDY